MKQKARLIIPLWGEVYAGKLATMTLPALLAPGNLPALCRMFDVELVIVTETRLFDWIRKTKSFDLVSKLCAAKLVPIDDLLTDTPGDYGVVLSYALYRGFTDLGECMTETYLLFLNADFIISDGSLRHVGELMQRGERVIHAPSFRVVLEDVWPQLEARVDPQNATLAVSSRDMAKLALANKHLTVRARTVNQRLCHQWRMDQFYWYVDENTLIGYQWPVALVAIKPERVTLEPSLVWDYAFLPDAAPTARRHFIGDSDSFFMLEPQKRTTGEDLVRLGWISPDDIAADLSKWTTQEQRDCGRQLLLFHSAELPEIGSVVEESREYMAEIYRRLPPVAQAHDKHLLLGDWFHAAKTRMRGQRISMPESSAAAEMPPLMQPAIQVQHLDRPASLLSRVLRGFYRSLFGQVPAVGKLHPLWCDTHAAANKIASWRPSKKILWVSSGDSLFYRLMDRRFDPDALRLKQPDIIAIGSDQYDVCFCDLSVDDFLDLRPLYDRLRSLVKNGGEICVYVFNKKLRPFQAADIGLCETAFPDLDISEIHFFGTRMNAAIRGRFMAAVNSFPGNALLRDLTSALVLLLLAPATMIANAIGASRKESELPAVCTSLMVNFKIRKAQ